MKINTDLQGDVVVVRLNGNLLGGPDADNFYNEVKSYLDQGNRRFVLDLANVRLMNSSGLGILIKALKPVREGGGDIHLAAVTERIDSLLVITKLYQVFQGFPDVEQAVRAFA